MPCSRVEDWIGRLLYYCRGSIVWAERMDIPMPERIREDPQLAYKLIKEYKIKCSELGISDRMLRYLKSGQKKLSLEKAEKLYRLIVQKLGIETEARLWARSSAWIERRPAEPEVRGSNPRGPATQ